MSFRKKLNTSAQHTTYLIHLSQRDIAVVRDLLYWKTVPAFLYTRLSIRPTTAALLIIAACFPSRFAPLTQRLVDYQLRIMCQR